MFATKLTAQKSKKVTHKTIHPTHHVPENYPDGFAIDAKKDEKEMRGIPFM